MTASDQTTPQVGGGGSTLSSLLGQILFVPFLGGGGLLGESLSVQYSAAENIASTVQCWGSHCQYKTFVFKCFMQFFNIIVITVVDVFSKC